VRVLDFSTLLPGPLATLLLAEAGAEVVKIERPEHGDEMRSYEPKLGPDSANFALLNRGKRSIAVDLKDPGAIERVLALVAGADVLVEQFRPGVMDRLGLGYERLRTLNPRLVYCAITGYGQSGPRAQDAAHDLNYVAESGLLALAAGADGAPGVPAALVADVAGGAYPAVMNILLALRQRDLTGAGCKLDVAMADNLFTFMYWALGSGLASGEWPQPGAALVTGGSPRYQVYRTADDAFVAAAPIEERFWRNFCAVIGLDPGAHDDAREPAGGTRGAAARRRARPAGHWRSAFAGKDVCACVVKTLEEAMADPHFVERGLFARRLVVGDRQIPALPVPVCEAFRAAAAAAASPSLGEGNLLLGGPARA
jgi:crotonobetainyl-CoA:carnitine CoA-transferase CaiB-like acyl-CoA transferase